MLSESERQYFASFIGIASPKTVWLLLTAPFYCGILTASILENLTGVAMLLPPAESARAVIPLIDHTLLRPEATQAQVQRLCDEALFYGFAAVCVLPWWLPDVARRLHGSPVKPCSVAGFPLGAHFPASKAAEAALCVEHGAREIDMVMSLGAFKDKAYTAVEHDIGGVVRAVGTKARVKVILETTLLTPAEIADATRLALGAGAAYVKTSTGFFGGATVEAVRLMRDAAGPAAGVKASGGIRSLADALAMIGAGANRIGTSAGVAIATTAV
jgi:deoxyribose-phosphate aldolase